MKRKTVVRIQEDIQCTHYFLYKNKKYPFNFYFLLSSSKYIQKNQNDIQASIHISLINNKLEDSLNIPEKAILDFIKYFHREPIEIDDENISGLNYLAIKYEIISLITFTKEYINQNQKDVIIDILTLDQNDPAIDTQSYEDFVSKWLLDFIEDDRLLFLKFPLLQRIVSKYEGPSNKALIGFFFKCVDKYGQAASVLFSKVVFVKS